MADSKYIVGKQDRRLINLSQDYEVHDWSKAFGVTPYELKRAVAEVGNNADDVREYLKGETAEAGHRH